MTLSARVLTIISRYLNLVSPEDIGDRLQQIWNGISQEQRDQIQPLIKPLYYKLFITSKPKEDIVEILNQIVTILTPVQRAQVYTLIKNDLIAAYEAQKNSIDSEINNTSGSDI